MRTGMPWNWAGFTKVKAMDCIPAQGSKCARLVGVTMVLQCCMLALHPFRSHHAALEQSKGLVALTNTSSLVDESAVLVDESNLDSPVLNSTALPLGQVVQNVDFDLEIKTLVCFKHMMLGVYIFCRFSHFCVCFVKWSKLPRIIKHWQFSGFWTNSTPAPNPPFGSIRIHRAQH